jgi:uncharacterized NAD(P)/FAD-binding protein YdhS
MTGGARTPEELELLLEDAFVTRDTAALTAMFADGGVLAAGAGGEAEARGARAIAAFAEELWKHERTYLARPRRVVQARDTAVVLGSGVSALRRGADGAWRYAIALLSLDSIPKEETE